VFPSSLKLPYRDLILTSSFGRLQLGEPFPGTPIVIDTTVVYSAVAGGRGLCRADRLDCKLTVLVMFFYQDDMYAQMNKGHFSPGHLPSLTERSTVPHKTQNMSSKPLHLSGRLPHGHAMQKPLILSNSSSSDPRPLLCY
jgi:hypothetical protein